MTGSRHAVKRGAFVSVGGTSAQLEMIYTRLLTRFKAECVWWDAVAVQEGLRGRAARYFADKEAFQAGCGDITTPLSRSTRIPIRFA